MRLLFDAADHHQRFTKIGLPLSRRMRQWHEYLFVQPCPGEHIPSLPCNSRQSHARTSANPISLAVYRCFRLRRRTGLFR